MTIHFHLEGITTLISLNTANALTVKKL